MPHVFRRMKLARTGCFTGTNVISCQRKSILHQSLGATYACYLHWLCDVASKPAKARRNMHITVAKHSPIISFRRGCRNDILRPYSLREAISGGELKSQSGAILLMRSDKASSIPGSCKSRFSRILGDAGIVS